MNNSTIFFLHMFGMQHLVICAFRPAWSLNEMSVIYTNNKDKLTINFSLERRIKTNVFLNFKKGSLISHIFYPHLKMKILIFCLCQSSSPSESVKADLWRLWLLLSCIEKKLNSLGCSFKTIHSLWFINSSKCAKSSFWVTTVSHISSVVGDLLKLCFHIWTECILRIRKIKVVPAYYYLSVSHVCPAFWCTNMLFFKHLCKSKVQKSSIT